MIRGSRSPFRSMPAVLAVLTLTAALTGCVAKSEFEALEARLGECQQDKLAAQEAAADCRRRADIDSARWDDVKNVVEEAMPRSLEEFREERDRIVELVPEQVREEVDNRLEKFYEQFGQAFSVLQNSNQELAAGNERIEAQLAETRGRLETLQDSVRSGNTALGDDLQKCFDLQERAGQRTLALIEQIQDFDRTYVNDQGSDDRLRLNRKERETIVNFHRQLIAALNARPEQVPTAAPTAGAADEGTGDEDTSEGG